MLNIICEKKTLNEAVNPALPVVPAKNTNQSLTGVLLTANKDDGTLTVCGYDLEKGVKVTVSGENIKINESGTIIVNAAKFSSIIKNLPDGDISVAADQTFSLTVKGGKSEFTVHGLDGGTYPLLPELKGKNNFKFPRKSLKNMIASTLFAVANNNSRPALNGSLFEVKDNQVNIVGCDGHRLSVRRNFDNLTSDEELDFKFIMPGKSLAELLKLLDGDDEKKAEIELTSKHVIVSFENIIFFSRLIEGEYLEYNKVSKIDPKTTAVINTKSFLESAERAALLTDEKQKSLIKLKFSKMETNIENKDDFGVLQISSMSAAGKTFDECDIEIYGEDIEIGFNQRFLADTLKAVKEEKVLLKLENSTKAMVILPYDKDTDVAKMDSENSKFLYLVLPIRLKD